jgi:glycosyltransferase involved in cell wall biosynthesis
VIVNQWVPSAHRGDAVGDSMRVTRDLLRASGHQAEIYALSADDGLEDVRPWGDAASRQGDVTIYHYAVPSPMTAAFRTLPGARVLQYHNVTPAHFFAPYDTGLCRMAAMGRRELATLQDATDLALGDSDFNRQELVRLGFRQTGVLPILIDPARLARAPRVPALERLLRQDGFANILFVGRIAPNKKIEDHLRLAEHYKRYINSDYRFIFVGKCDAVPRYFATIQALVGEYRMLPERFWFTGPVPDAELGAYYRHAHAYVSLSEHEGFSVPLVEAMSMDVPILAYGAAAVPETLGGAGVCFAPKDLEYAAELLGALVFDEPLRQRVIAGQRARLADFTPARVAAELQAVLASVA